MCGDINREELTNDNVRFFIRFIISHVFYRGRNLHRSSLTLGSDHISGRAENKKGCFLPPENSSYSFVDIRERQFFLQMGRLKMIKELEDP